MRNGRLATHSHAAVVALVFAAMAWAVQPVPASAQSCAIAECLSSHSDPAVARNGRWLRRYLRVQRRDQDAAVRLWRRTVRPPGDAR